MMEEEKEQEQSDKIIGKGTWIDKLAHEMIQREKSLDRPTDTIRVESGLGASGIPHIGSLGDAIRAYGVKMALDNFGYNSELLAYSDDMDGLRKIPDDLPEWLNDHIAKPVSMIPDPFGDCHDSYGLHMSSILLEGLDKLGIKYRFQRAVDTYKQGLVKEQTHTILSQSEKIGKKIAELVGQEKYQNYLPYFPVCANCGRLYTAEATEYVEDEQLVRYSCNKTTIGSKVIEGCGHKDVSRLGKDLGKLAWKVEFAARWSAFDVRFEAYGKDIMDSVKVNDWVSDEVLGFPHPHHVRYEMFLDKGGKKISKSLGNVLTTQKWLRYGTPQSLLLLLYKRIAGTREVGFDDIPALMDEYNELENIYFGKSRVENESKAIKYKGLYEYVNLLNPPKEPKQHVSFRLLIELCKIFKEDRTSRVTKKLIDYGSIKEPYPELEYLIDLAGNYADDFDRLEKMQDIEIDSKTKIALQRLYEVLNTDTQESEQQRLDMQNTIYKIAKKNEISPRDFFKTLYKIILATDRGPKMGPFILDIGTRKVAKIIEQYL